MNKKVCMALVALSVLAIKVESVMAAENPIYGIHEVDNVDAMQTKFDQLCKTKKFNPKGALAVLDEDGTLIYRYGPEVGGRYGSRWSKLADAVIGRDTDAVHELKRTYYRDHIQLLVDEKFPTFVEGLQKKGIKCAILTSKVNENLGKVNKNLGQVVIDRKSMNISAHDIFNPARQKFGFNFAKGWGNLQHKTLGDKSKGNLSYFIDGVIYAGKTKTTLNSYKEHNKVIALDNFINCAQQNNQLTYFDTLIAIDDQKYNLENLEQYAKANDIKFVGFHFTGDKKFSRIEENNVFDAQYELYRLTNFKENNKWDLPQGADSFYKDEKGVWHLKEVPTSSMDSTMLSSDSEVICNPVTPQGKIDSK